MRKGALLIVCVIAAVVLYTAGPWRQTSPEPNNSPIDMGQAQILIPGPDQGESIYEIDPSRSEARYRVREQLVGVSFPQDAVGITQGISGRVGFNESGTVLDGSAIRVNLASLQSDESRRDNFVRSNILRTQQYPEAIFAPRELKGIPHPLPVEGAMDLVIVGDLTIQDVTRQVEWRGNAQFFPGHFAVSASVAFPFGEFNLTQPRVAIVLSVDDEIRLEADLHLTRIDSN